MRSFTPFFATIWRLYKHGPTLKRTIGSPYEHFPSMFTSLVSLFSGSSYASLLWYSTNSGKPLNRAYRKRVNKRFRLANKPILDEIKFNKAVSNLPARFTAVDLYNVLSLENDPLVCLELFNWASKQHRFNHDVTTFHKTIQKLGISGMIEEMYDIVDQVITLPSFGSEALYNTVIYYYTKARKLSRAVTVFKHMKKVDNPDCKPSVRTYNLLFGAFIARGTNTYINHVYMVTMQCLFKQMINDGIEPNNFTLNSMILGYVLSNHANDALRIFHQMGFVYTSVPDSVTYDHLIYGLCAQSRTNNAIELFNKMKEKGFVASVKMYNSLVNALALVGDVDEAMKYLWEMNEKRIRVDFITYKTVLDELCRKGRASEALNFVDELKEKRVVDGLRYIKLVNVVKDDFRVQKNHF